MVTDGRNGMIPKLSYESLADQVKTYLLEYIHARGMRPGDVLPAEHKLAAEFGVSRPVIREALKALEGMSVVEVSKGKGAVVRALDKDPLVVFFNRAVSVAYVTIAELLEFRKVIEGGCASLAALHRDPTEVAEMETLIREMEVSLSDADAYTELDARFHGLVAAAAHNRLLLQVTESIREATTESIREGRRHVRSREQMERVQSLHQDLFRQIKRGNRAGARRAINAHFDEAVDALARDEEYQESAIKSAADVDDVATSH